VYFKENLFDGTVEWGQVRLATYVQTGNKGPDEILLRRSLREFHGASDLLSVDFGMKEWNEHSPKEIVRKYREFVYETGAVEAGKGAVIDQKIVDKERKKKYKVRRVDRFMYRTRYFTDAGIIGSPVKSCCACHFVNFTGQARSSWARPR